MNSSLKLPLSLIALAAIAVSSGCTNPLVGNSSIEQTASAEPKQTQVETPSPISSSPIDASAPDYVADIVAQVGPAVVRIDSSRAVEQPLNNLDFGSLFGREQRGQRQREQDQPQRVQRGTGSGFITSADGRIFTNAHVVAGADTVSVVLKDGRRFKGEVVGSDEMTDVAVIKINASGLPTVKMGDSDRLLPGQTAIAIGNPLGLDNTVTQGIISATGRSGADFGSSSRVNFIQTDTAINPGNSGGPLINSKGEVVGMNTAIIQGAFGIGFAVPIATAQRVADQLITSGKVDHPYLGVQMAELTPELREQINRREGNVSIEQDQGVIILAVQRNSPAAAGGLKAGDVIEAINGTAIQASKQVQQQVESAKIGNPLQITVKRNGQSVNLTVKPAPMPDQNG
ncbi:trypsin-like peptidase domain-containing protein [Phormidium sp. CLA17]|uniref:HhoA/HhoB/HtrA family serine endopeptidase n=1 Tax=Leptolyngbya sp. Cla-17 TaxID=2803751 RepID=UPI001490E4B1|nr:HhoA/HhoB/HtrA family serine endopeptidase [Leptolyngbya sp. Cla-17]MBM0742578.1 trypsin-like peptidase domain-containing protein [Leptolyngbya sp. Cla-17]